MLILLIIMALCVCVCAVLGYWVARRVGGAWSVVLAGLVCAGMLLFGRYMADDVWVVSVVPARIVPVFGNWLPPMAGLLAGMGWKISPRRAAAKAMVMGVFVGLAMYVPYRSLFAERPTVREKWRGDVCMQTTNATCAAAAGATLLRSVGIEASEREMVELCFTTMRGTSLSGLVYGMSRKLEGTPWQVRACKLTARELEDLERPAIIYVGLQDGQKVDDPRYETVWGWAQGVMHTVIYFGPLGADSCDIGDPAVGRERWNADAMRVLWHGVAVVIERR